MAVDPTNSSHAIAVFQQDRWSGGGAKGVLASISSDGGGSWTEPALTNQPAFSQCTAASSAFPRASDPWVSIGSNAAGTGTIAYYAALGLNGAETISSVQVSTSTNDGSSWNTPKVLISDDSTSSTFILDDKDRNEKPGDAKLYHSAPPIVHVFDRTGKKVAEYEGKKQAGQLDGLLEELIKKK